LRTRLTFGRSDEKSPIWSPDGGRIVFSARPKGPLDLYQSASSGVGGDDPLLEDEVDKVPTGWSPDGHFILYYRPSPGGHNVAPFPSAAGKWRISTDGGAWPQWRRDGREIFYVQSENSVPITLAVNWLALAKR